MTTSLGGEDAALGPIGIGMLSAPSASAPGCEWWTAAGLQLCGLGLRWGMKPCLSKLSPRTPPFSHTQTLHPGCVWDLGGALRALGARFGASRVVGDDSLSGGSAEPPSSRSHDKGVFGVFGDLNVPHFCCRQRTVYVARAVKAGWMHVPTQRLKGLKAIKPRNKQLCQRARWTLKFKTFGKLG